MKEGIKTIGRNKERGKEKKARMKEGRKTRRREGRKEFRSNKTLALFGSVPAVPLHCFVTLDMLLNISKSWESHV